MKDSKESTEVAKKGILGEAKVKFSIRIGSWAMSKWRFPLLFLVEDGAQGFNIKQNFPLEWDFCRSLHKKGFEPKQSFPSK